MSQLKLCPYCGEEIKDIAIKCRYCGTLLTSASLPPRSGDPTTQIRLALSNKYEIIQEIGRGGMAVVYKAVQRNLRRVTALKVLPSQFTHDQEFLQRFHREAQEAARLNHPNIVTIYDEGTENGIHYIEMEFLDGTDLHTHLRQNGAMAWKDAVGCIAPIADALGYAHRMGVIHRDVKSGNVYITEAGRPVLMDFGIAHAADGERLTQPGTIIGTPEYMSPEQADGGSIDGRSDLYSLGVVLFECITGQVPLKGDNPVSTIHKIIYDEVPATKTFGISLAKREEKILRRSLKKQSSARFQTGEEFAAALYMPGNVPDEVEDPPQLTQKFNIEVLKKGADAPLPGPKQDNRVSQLVRSGPAHEAANVPGNTVEVPDDLQPVRTDMNTIVIRALVLLVVVFMSAFLYYFFKSGEGASSDAPPPAIEARQPDAGPGGPPPAPGTTQQSAPAEQIVTPPTPQAPRSQPVMPETNPNAIWTSSGAPPAPAAAPKLTALELRFFEHGSHGTRDEKNYQSVFTATSARFITCELILSHPAPVADVSVKLSVEWRAQKNDEAKEFLLYQASSNISILKDKRASVYESARGSSTPDSWDPGKYTVIISYQKTELARGSFTVTE